jgi:hypothetical protein
MLKSVKSVKNKLLRTLGMLLLMACFSDAFSQSFKPDSITNRFAEYSELNLQEKVYVHTDRELYLAGEILWFKLYNVNTVSNTSIDFSKVAYVEIIDKNQNLFCRPKLQLIRVAAVDLYICRYHYPAAIISSEPTQAG